MLLTLGVKNLFGCIPGTKKALWHLKTGEDQKAFAQMLVDLYLVIRPSLTILDGIVGMEGGGPGSGDPIPLGLILASGDPLSLDQIVCDLLGISRNSLMTNRIAVEQGLGRNGIEVVGERPEDVEIHHFRLPNLTRVDWNLPGFLKKALNNAISSRPVADEEVCKECGQCVEICPPGALHRIETGLSFDYGKCIRCFCCQEICPEGAIRIKPGWALKLVGRKQKAESRNGSEY
jgi:ferredoxin